MYHNKALGAAIAMALSLGVSSAEAGTFQKCLMQSGSILGSTTDPTTMSCPDTAVVYAYEQFGTTDVSLSYPFRVRYTPSSTIGSNYDFYITFTLSNGATWQNPAVTSSSLRFEDSTGAIVSGPQISIVAKGASTDSSVSYLINSSKAAGVGTDKSLDFEFRVAGAQNALKSAGGTISLSVDLRTADTTNPTTGTVVDTPTSTLLASSAEGATITIQAPQDGTKAYISVLSNSTAFEGSGVKTPLQVSYGDISISNNTSSNPQSISTTTVSGTPWTPSTGSFESGTLTIDNGNFAASGAVSDGKVYIAKNDYTSLVPATSLSTDGTTAKWEFKGADLYSIYSTTSSATSPPDFIVLNVKGGTATINENRQVAPKATLFIKYASGASITRTATLRHLKKNGSVCTVYNIPPSDALDVINLRITNDSSSAKGFVKGTLRDTDGKEIFTSKMLVDVDKLPPHGTVHLTISDLTAGGNSWTKRGVLRLESNIPEPNMQVFALLRAKGSKAGFPESPLMNMSTGATGSGCD